MKYWSALVVVLVIVLVWALWRGSSMTNVHLPGMWAGTPDFLKKAGLEEFVLLVGPDISSSYLLMANEDGKTVANAPVCTVFAESFASCAMAALYGGSIKGTLLCEAFPEGTLPECVEFVLDVENGTLTLFDDQKIYAALYKDTLASLATSQ